MYHRKEEEMSRSHVSLLGCTQALGVPYNKEQEKMSQSHVPQLQLVYTQALGVHYKELEKISHFNHDHPLMFTQPTNFYYCHGCEELGREACYRCTCCELSIHKECAKASMEHDDRLVINHPLSEKCKLVFRRDNPRSKSCHACGKEVKRFGYNCLCMFVKRQFHPVCLNCLPSIKVADGLTLKLQKSAKAQCLRCDEWDLTTTVRGWAYVSPCGKLCYHVSCVRAIIHDFWKKKLISDADDPLEAVRLSFPVDWDRSNTRQQKKRISNKKEVGIKFLKGIVSVGKLASGQF